MNVILSVLKFCCKALNFIRNFVMNFVFLLFVLSLIVLVSLFSDGKKNQVLSGDQGALYLNLTGYLADNTEDMLSWQEEFQRLNNEKVSYKYSTFDVVQSILSAKDDVNSSFLIDFTYTKNKTSKINSPSSSFIANLCINNASLLYFIL